MLLYSIENQSNTHVSGYRSTSRYGWYFHYNGTCSVRIVTFENGYFISICMYNTKYCDLNKTCFITLNLNPDIFFSDTQLIREVTLFASSSNYYKSLCSLYVLLICQDLWSRFTVITAIYILLLTRKTWTGLYGNLSLDGGLEQIILFVWQQFSPLQRRLTYTHCFILKYFRLQWSN